MDRFCLTIQAISLTLWRSFRAYNIPKVNQTENRRAKNCFITSLYH